MASPVDPPSDTQGISLSGTWRAAPADEADPRDYHDPAFDDSSWALATVPGHWRSNPAFADTDGPVLHRTAFTGPGAVRAGGRELAGCRPRGRPAVVARARRDLLHERRLARRHLPGRHRGLLLPPRVRGDRGAGRKERAHPRPRGGLSPPGGPHRQAQPHRGLPALGPARRGLEPRRHLAAGAHRAVRPRAHTPRPRPVRRCQRPSGPSCRCGPCSTPSTPGPSTC